MQRLTYALVGRRLVLRAAQCRDAPLPVAALLTACRFSSSQVPPSIRPPTAAVSPNSSDKVSPSAQAGAPELDAEAAEQVRLAQQIGEEAFGENTAILKQVGYRGLRAFLVCAVGLGAFAWAMKRKKKELAAEEAGKAGTAVDEEDPTQRYLEEMRSLGFDVDTLEEELEQERAAKRVEAPPTKAVA